MANLSESKLNFGVRGPLANARRERFAQALALRTPRLEAMKSAGFPKPSEPNARRLANEPGVKARVNELMLQEAEQVGAQAGAILLEMCRLAFANIYPLLKRDEVGNVLPVLDPGRPIPPELALAVQELGYDSKGRPKIKLHDKAAVLRDLAKIYELFSDSNTNIAVNVGLGDDLDKAFSRAGL
jgi:hypothetical protein